LGNVTEVVLPDDVKGFSHNGSPIEFGVAAVDELGNESDLATFKASYQFNIPLAPEGMWIENLDEFHIQSEEPQKENSQEPKKKFCRERFFERCKRSAGCACRGKRWDWDLSFSATVQRFNG
jgi:hypothetical protein